MTAKPTPRARELLDRMCDWLDAGNGSVRTIRMNIMRKYALRIGCKPEKRGAPLQYRGREIVTREIEPT